jgi:hypothetical protein
LQTGASGSISGTIRDIEGHSVSLGHVDVFDETFSYLWTVDASPGGAYSIDALYQGTYYLVFWNGDTEFIWDYFVELYREQPLLRTEVATPLVVGPGAHLTGIDARLRWLYDDMFDHVFEDDIYWMGNAGITYGCDPPLNHLYCPNLKVSRGQMAAFLVRTLALTDRGNHHFVDDDDSIFEVDIEKLAAAGITYGCDPPANDRFCPDQPVTRGQMAAFLHRAVMTAAPSPRTPEVPRPAKVAGSGS